MKGVLAFACVASLGICIGVGCAKSENDDPLLGVGVQPTDPADAGDAGKKKVVVGDDDDDKKPASNGDDDDSTSSSSSSSGNTSSSSSSGATSSSSSSSSSSGSPGPIESCKVTTCNTAKTQTAMAGDQNSSRTISGSVSQWFTVDVTENVTGIFSSGQSLRLKATLVSPPGKNFDLFLYLPDSGGVKECHHGEESSENAAGQDDVVSLMWGEPDGGDPNRQSDTRTVTVEVREIVDPAAPAPAACDASTAKWSLKLEGNK